jgi:hypothetical protein
MRSTSPPGNYTVQVQWRDRSPDYYDVRAFVTVGDSAVQEARTNWPAWLPLGFSQIEGERSLIRPGHRLFVHNVSAGTNEYWRYPWDAVRPDRREDTSILYAAIVEVIGTTPCSSCCQGTWPRDLLPGSDGRLRPLRHGELLLLRVHRPWMGGRGRAPRDERRGRRLHSGPLIPDGSEVQGTVAKCRTPVEAIISIGTRIPFVMIAIVW